MKREPGPPAAFRRRIEDDASKVEGKSARAMLVFTATKLLTPFLIVVARAEIFLVVSRVFIQIDDPAFEFCRLANLS